MQSNRLRFISGGTLFFVLWGAAIAACMWYMAVYDATPGKAAKADSTWPAGLSRIAPQVRLAQGRTDTIVMLAHPRCPCTRASVGELARILARTGDRLSIYVIFYEPMDAGDDWLHTDLIASARGIDGAHVLMDPNGTVTALFHARTSGQVLLYSSDGALQFSGGITAGRGHYGDNAGSDAIVSLVLTGRSAVHSTPVYGCSLISSALPDPAAREIAGRAA